MSGPLHDPDLRVAEVGHGVRVVTIAQPQRQTANVSVFVRTGSQHEARRQGGISHVVEHMAFKGTLRRDCQRINLDAEVLGAEVNAHTDKDHTAFHIDGLARDAGRFVAMLAEIVQESVFPPAELERERQVILQELAEDEDDGVATAFRLFDQACYGDHPFARPVAGSRRSIQRLQRDELQAYVQSQYTASNIVVGVAGGIDPERIVAAAGRAFATLSRGAENRVDAPVWCGGLKTRRLPGSTQTHAVVGFPAASRHEAPEPFLLAAALFGEGMSSPLLDQIRERRGLAYHLACSADIGELGGQFVIEASTAPEHAEAFLAEAWSLLAAQARAIDPVALARARNQLAVRSLRQLEQGSRRLEAAALDLFVRGEVQTVAQSQAKIAAVTPAELIDLFERLISNPPAIAITGRLRKGLAERARGIFAAPPVQSGSGR